MPFAEDMSVFFNAGEFGTVATFTFPGRRAETAVVLLDSPTQDVLGSKAQSNEFAIRLPVAAFPGINRGHVVTINGADFEVRESPDLIDDGAVKHIKLTKLK